MTKQLMGTQKREPLRLTDEKEVEFLINYRQLSPEGKLAVDRKMAGMVAAKERAHG
jgi:hypothetical protein